MATVDQPAARSGAVVWTGYIMSALPALFLIFDAVMKLVKPDFVVEATVAMGFSENVIVPLGVVLLVSALVYIVPRTAVIGAILLTGYLGGAVATHVLVGDDWFSILFPVVFGVFLWGGLVLQEDRLRILFFRRS